MPESNAPTVLILEHTVKRGQEKKYEEWLGGVVETLQAAPGFVGRDIFPPNLPDRPYTIVVRFETNADLQAWVHSPEHKALRLEARDMLDQTDHPSLASGSDLWLARDPNPKQYKLLLISVVAIFPLTILVPFFVERFFDTMAPTMKGTAVAGIIQTAIIGALMSYMVMPQLTHRFRRWLLGTMSSGDREEIEQ